MPPPNGSDSERLLAEIEAYLRTGEAPPAAPEPAGGGQARAELPGAGTGGSAGSAGAGGSAGRVRRAGRVRGAGRLRRLTGRRPSPRTGPWNREWSGATLHPSAGRSAARAPVGAPRWTVLRVVLVVGFLTALLLVPVIWKRGSSSVTSDGADHASAAPAGAGYTFLQVNRSGTPVRWNPCAAIHYQLDLASAPSWAETDIGDAISSISMATGIQFAYDGPTNQFPDGQVPAGAASGEPPPVVIAWANVAQSRELNLAEPVAAGASGVGAVPGVDSLARTYPVMAKDDASGHGVYMTGSVVIGAAASTLSDGFAPGGAGVLLLHQLGRLMGLGDVADPSQIMNTDVLATPVAGLGRGDRAGLARLGARSGCLKVPVDPSLYVGS